MKRTLKLAGFCLLTLLLLLCTTNPEGVPSAILVIPFAMIFLTLLLVLLQRAVSFGITKGKSIRLSVVGAALPTLLLVLQSLGQLTLRDILTILVLFGIAYFYIARITSPSNC